MHHLTHVNRWSEFIGYWIEIVSLIGTLSTILQHFTHTMKPSDPQLLANGNLRCGKYPTSKVAISQHLAIPRFPQSDHTVSEPTAAASLLCSEA